MQVETKFSPALRIPKITDLIVLQRKGNKMLTYDEYIHRMTSKTLQAPPMFSSCFHLVMS